MKAKHSLDILTNLPYKTVTLFNGKNTEQRTVVFYSDITKRIGENRAKLQKRGFHYFDGKLINTVSSSNVSDAETKIEKRR